MPDSQISRILAVYAFKSSCGRRGVSNTSLGGNVYLTYTTPLQHLRPSPLPPPPPPPPPPSLLKSRELDNSFHSATGCLTLLVHPSPSLSLSIPTFGSGVFPVDVCDDPLDLVGVVEEPLAALLAFLSVSFDFK